ncbi:hypothetical protein [Candidatus Nanohalovita haloferacivicina]|uniref:hypothetical protein n=1 Tax=Candidatus Nanohalovita haloferacivicina TaxID=2978046 RepID=UPI00325FC8B4|nr:hypothetical protein HBNXNv_0941 [Candidatus Nanohalobia archaeon BNXNv]
MSKIRDRLGDRLEPGNSSGMELNEEKLLEEDTTPDRENTVSYPIHYSEGAEGDYVTLNFSDPVGKKTLIPDYTATRVSNSDSTEVWSVGAEEGTVEVEVDSNIKSKDKLANALKTAYDEAIR